MKFNTVLLNLNNMAILKKGKYIIMNGDKSVHTHKFEGGEFSIVSHAGIDNYTRSKLILTIDGVERILANREWDKWSNPEMYSAVMWFKEAYARNQVNEYFRTKKIMVAGEPEHDVEPMAIDPDEDRYSYAPIVDQLIGRVKRDDWDFDISLEQVRQLEI